MPAKTGINSGLNKVSVTGTEGLQERVCFSTFFANFPHLTLFSYVKQVKKLSFKLKSFADTKTLKTMLTEYAVSCFFLAIYWAKYWYNLKFRILSVIQHLFM